MPSKESAEYAKARTIADALRELFYGMRISVEIYSNGNWVNGDIDVKGRAVFKVKVNYLVLPDGKGRLTGQIQMNGFAKDEEQRKSYWDLLANISAAGFRSQLPKPQGREYFQVPGTEGFANRVHIIKLNTIPLADPIPSFQKLVQIIADFEKIDLAQASIQPAVEALPQQIVAAPQQAPTESDFPLLSRTATSAISTATAAAPGSWAYMAAEEERQIAEPTATAAAPGSWEYMAAEEERQIAELKRQKEEAEREELATDVELAGKEKFALNKAQREQMEAELRATKARVAAKKAQLVSGEQNPSSAQ